MIPNSPSTERAPAKAEGLESILGSLALMGDRWEGQVLFSIPASRERIGVVLFFFAS